MTPEQQLLLELIAWADEKAVLLDLDALVQRAKALTKDLRVVWVCECGRTYRRRVAHNCKAGHFTQAKKWSPATSNL